MPTMSSILEPIQKHVPAWKKLGLKLKFAKEEPEDIPPNQNGTTNRKKRKASTEEGEIVENVPIERSAKKPKKSKLGTIDAGEVVNGYGSSSYEPANDGETRRKTKRSKHATDDPTEAINGSSKPSDDPTNAPRASKKVKKSKAKADVSTGSVNGKPGGTLELESSPPPALRTTPASKRKSVSFTPDTKTKDGDSVKGLYKTWVANQIANDPSFDPSTVSPVLQSIVPSTIALPVSPSPVSVTSTSPPTSETTTKNNKKPPKRPKTRLPKTSSGPGPSRFDPVLSYLTTHKTSPQTWKFSKPHQNQILKHLFSLNHIPSSYDTALLSYIRGLKGTSARARVRKEALAVREQDNKWLASEGSEPEKMENETAAQCIARRRRDYEAAVARIKQTLREKEEEREEREWELLGEKEEWEERIRKRRRAEIVLWNVGEEEEEEEAVEDDTSALPRQNTSEGNPGRPMKSGVAQLVQAARDPGPAPRVGRGVGMGMGGVEVIDAGGIAKGSLGKKVVFGDDGAAHAAGSKNVNGFGGVNGVGQANGVHGFKTPDSSDTNGVKPKRKRKRKRRTGVPDDDESTSSSSSSEDSEEEEQKKQGTSLKNAARDSSDDETSSSDSDSGTSSSSSEDSESD